MLPRADTNFTAGVKVEETLAGAASTFTACVPRATMRRSVPRFQARDDKVVWFFGDSVCYGLPLCSYIFSKGDSDFLRHS